MCELSEISIDKITETQQEIELNWKMSSSLQFSGMNVNFNFLEGGVLITLH